MLSVEHGAMERKHEDATTDHARAERERLAQEHLMSLGAQENFMIIPSGKDEGRSMIPPTPQPQRPPDVTTGSHNTRISPAEKKPALSPNALARMVLPPRPRPSM
jgi:hypothetical protein